METITAKQICQFYTREEWGKEVMNGWLKGIIASHYGARDVLDAAIRCYHRTYQDDRFVSKFDETVILDALNRLARNGFRYK